VLRHGPDGFLGIASDNRRGDLGVIAGAPGDQSGVEARPEIEMLEVEAEIVQSIGYPLEHGVARNLRQLLVEAAVEDAKADRVALHRAVRGYDSLKVGDVSLARLGRGAPDDLDLDHATAVEGIPEVGLGQREIKVERGEQSSCVQIADEGPAAMP